MTAPFAPPEDLQMLAVPPAGAWRASLVRLGLLALAYAALFYADLVDLVRVWLTSTPYGHCVFLPPIIGWLVWQRRKGLAGLQPRGWPPALLWLGLGAILWLLGWAGGVALFRHAALIVMAQGLVLSTLGPVVGRAIAFPLFYAVFMIPVGTEAEPVMQILTARMAVQMLWITGVPAEISGIFISTPNGAFRVAEACSGTGFLIVMAAFSTLVAHLCFRSMRRRILFVAAALPLCLLANGLRAFGIIYIAYHTSIDSAVVVDHVMYGGLFFALVLGGAVALGLPFYDRSPLDVHVVPHLPDRALGQGRGTTRAVLIAALALMAAPVGWAVAAHAFTEPLPAETRLPQVPGWTQDETGLLPSWQPHFRGADRIVIGHYRDAQDRVVDLAIILFAGQTDGKELVGFGQGAASPDGLGDWFWAEPAPAPDKARGDMLAGPRGQRRIAWTFYHVGGALTGKASRVKLETLKVRLLGGDERAAAILLSTPAPDAAQGARTLADFQAALGSIEDLADRSLAIR